MGSTRERRPIVDAWSLTTSDCLGIIFREKIQIAKQLLYRMRGHRQAIGCDYNQSAFTVLAAVQTVLHYW